jgi:hypothetical protein
MVIKSDTGNVGIGTASPGAKLDIAHSTINVAALRVYNSHASGAYGLLVDNTAHSSGTSYYIADFRSAGASRLKITNDGAVTITGTLGVQGATTLSTATLSSSTNMLLTLNPTAGNYGGILFQYGGATKGSSIYNSGNLVYGGEAGVGVSLQAGGQYGLFIHHSTRNVGIGNGWTAPSYKLEVTGTLGVTDNAYFAGNVGINVVNPSNEFEIRADDSHMRLSSATTIAKGLSLLFNNSDNAGQLRCDQAGVNQLNMGYYALNQYFGRNSSNITMYLTHDNKVGIGTTAPEAVLTVAQPSSGAGLIVRTNESTASQRAGGGFSSFGSATAANRIAHLWLDADEANFGGSDYFYIAKKGNGGDTLIVQQNNANMDFQTSGTKRMRITGTAQNGMVGINGADSAWIDANDKFGVSGRIFSRGYGHTAMALSRYNSAGNAGENGNIIDFLYGGAGIGTIKTLGANNLTISGTVASHAGISFATNAILPVTAGATNTNTVDLGATSEQYKDLHVQTAKAAAVETGAYAVRTNNATYLGSKKLGNGTTHGVVLYEYDTFYNDWNTSTNTVDIFETSNDITNWGTKYIMIELFHDTYSGGGYARYFWNNQYNMNTLTQIEKVGTNSGVTAQVTGGTDVTGNIDKFTFQIVFGYYQMAYIKVTSTMQPSSSITAANQLHFFV